MKSDFDLIVIGAGHAGCEASLACARMGLSVLLVTLHKEKIGYMSCNPAIGGVGKSQLVKEIDALGGEMAKAADLNAIQFRILNSSKGYAARSSREQIDSRRYNNHMAQVVTNEPGIEVLEDEVASIIIKNGEAKGVKTKGKKEITSKAVIITTGTFLGGLIHIGLKNFPGGRIGEEASVTLSENIKSLGIKMGRLKTGTTPRLDGNTIDFSALKAQYGDKEIIPFSFSNSSLFLKQVPCYITRTNKNTHRIIKENLNRSPLYAGKIKSTGVRYCPSIEDKIVRFYDKESHTIFLEPESLDNDDYYPNGISTSLPQDAQEEIVHSITGLEKAKIVRPGYGIEYDFIEPTELYPTLESKAINNLYMAGQINGTTGYEEAAALGFMAGVNAALKIEKKEPLVLKRSEAYAGVLIDDLVTKGTKEPYRMFTSRVEHRLVIREDNADIRLMDTGKRLGLITSQAYSKMKEKEERIKEEKKRLEENVVKPSKAVNDILSYLNSSPISTSVRLSQILSRSQVSYDDLVKFDGTAKPLSYYEKVQLEIEVKYKGYINRELANIKRFDKIDRIKIPDSFDYSAINGLSNEIKEKLNKFKPYSVGQASRISGVTPSAISLLMVKLHANESINAKRLRPR